MEGRVQEGKGVSVEEGRFLLMGLQKFYGWEGKGESTRRRLMEQFSGGDEGFKVEELLEEAERVP
jgi:ATP synthase F1 complex assembly factor 1